MATSNTTAFTKPNDKPFVVRISGILSTNASEAEDFVRRKIEELSGDQQDVITDLTIVPSCTDNNSFVAIVDFSPLPQFLSSLKDSSRESYVLQISPSYDLVFDAKFLGFTQTYRTEREPTADIVFVPGLGSHPYGSWTSKSEPWRNWPRHFLCTHLQNTRVMIYGHHCTIRGTGFGQLIDLSRGFGNALKQIRKADIDRPIVFVAHSLGGNILKSFLVQDQRSGASTFKATCGILFFAVPHRGMDVEDMMTAIQYADTSQIRIRQISEEPFWRQELSSFVDIIRDCRVASFYELNLTNRLVQKDNGSFARDGVAVRLVPPYSATIGLQNESTHPVDADHSAIVKFHCQFDPAFTQALDYIRESLYTSDQKFTPLDQETLQCLRNLQATSPEHDMNRIEASKDPLLKDCYDWILGDPQLREWRDGESSLLWINGDPGKGKTMLMIALARELSNSPRASRSLTYFFCQNTDPRLNNVTSILRGLIWQLASNNPPLARIFKRKYDMEKHLFDGPNAIYALFAALSEMAEGHSRTYLLIDALDECRPGTDRDQLLALIIKNIKASSRVKWLLSSRNHLEIKQLLKLESEALSLNLNDDHISKSVRVFIEYKTNELARKGDYTESLKVDIKKELIARANTTFLWVALACKNLSKVRSWKALSSLQSMPPRLQPLYARMLDQILKNEDEDDRELCLRLLRSVALALRPLSIQESIVMADLPDCLTGDSVSELVELCGSFIAIRQDHLYFVHQSAKDYLISATADKLFVAGIPEENGDITVRSLEAMSRTLKKDICNLGHPGAPVPEVIDSSLRAISYACCFWVEHLASCLNEDAQGKHLQLLSNNGKVHVFLLKHLLNSVEALALIKRSALSISALSSLGTLINTYAKGICYHFVYDAIRLVLQCRAALEQAPLQIYVSGLLFAPDDSPVRQNFVLDIPHWINKLPRVGERWSPLLQTLEGHKKTVRTLAFSPDGRHLATVSNYETMQLWDVATGTRLRDFEKCSTSVVTLSFGPEGGRLLTCSSNRTVQVWDTMSGDVLHTFVALHTTEDPSYIFGMSFSPDGKKLALGLFDSTIQLWDIKTGAVLRMLKGHRKAVNTVDFTADGKRLASGSNDKTVRLWDTWTGIALRVVECHTEIFRTALSPCGNRLAWGSYDGTVGLWNTTGAAEVRVLHQSLDKYEGFIYAVKFSSCGSLLAAGLPDGKIQFFDGLTGALLRDFESYDGPARAIAFSPDGKRIASISNDRTVQLWDGDLGSDICRTLMGHNENVTILTFSQDGKTMASSSTDMSIFLWDPMTGAVLQILQGHEDWVSGVKFSQSGRLLASRSIDFTFRIWDTMNGAGLILKTSRDYPMFSPTDRYFVSPSYYGTVRMWDFVFSPGDRYLVARLNEQAFVIWDTTNATNSQVFTNYTGPIKKVDFSLDERQLIIVPFDDSVQIWDANTDSVPQDSRIFTNCRTESTYIQDDQNTPRPSFPSLYFNEEKSWIECNSKAIIWIPPSYRPSTVNVYGDCIAIGCSTGLVYFIWVDTEALATMINI